MEPCIKIIDFNHFQSILINRLRLANQPAMENYLRQLHGDIDASIAEAPSASEYDWIHRFRDEEDEEIDSSKFVHIADLTGIPAIAFPPEHLLTDGQLSYLLIDLQRLLLAWKFTWEMPLYLPERRQYVALLKEMNGDPVQYHYEWGGKVQICRFKEKGDCPFGADQPPCFCKYVEECGRFAVSDWEENVRAMGLDPHRELTDDEEKEIEESMRLHQFRKFYGDDWKKYYRYEFPYNEEEWEGEQLEITQQDVSDLFNYDLLPLEDDYEEMMVGGDKSSPVGEDISFEEHSSHDHDSLRPKDEEDNDWGFYSGDERDNDLPF